MKNSVAAILLFVLAGGLAAAESVKNQQLKGAEVELAVQFDAYKRDAVAPIAKAYVTKLEALMKQYSDSKDFVSAKRIQDLIDRTKLQYLDTTPASLPIIGEWKCKEDPKYSRIFFSDGRIKLLINGIQSEGFWKRDGDVFVGSYNGKERDAITVFDRDTLKIKTFGKTYTFERIK